jgi:dolichyl-diphosphooligosaccharide--protein glycosyltransferase
VTGRGAGAAAGLVAIAAAAFALRAQGWDAVAAGGHVALPIGDAPYHARRALWTAQHWPSLLLFDPLVGFPDGSWIPWPPLHTWLVAGLARALGGDAAAVERIALWLPPLLGALATLPVFAAAARLGGRAAGLGAAALFAALPAHVQYSGPGNVDHHCTVSLLGAAWLAAALAAAAPGARPVRPALGVTLARIGVVLTWPGSLAFLAIADGAQLAVLGLAGRARALAAHALGLAASAALVAAVVPRLGPPVGGPWSAIALSWLHVAALLALAFAAAALAAWERARPGAAPRARALRLAAALAAAAAALLAWPGPREALASALAFVGQREPWAALNAEQRPLFRAGPGGWLAPLAQWGGLGFAIPLLPLAALAAAREERVREPARVLALWTAGFGVLALAQIRYGNELAAPAAVAAVLGVRAAWRALAARPRGGLARAALVVLVVAALLPLALRPIARARAPAPPAAGDGDPRLATPEGTLDRFAETLRAVTPESGGFDDLAPPAYGVLAPPNLGHALRWGARRALVADNFGPYAGSRHFQEARGFSWLESEAQAVALAARLRARFVVTAEYGAMPPRSLATRLHRDDGRARAGAPRWERFRLIAEGPAGGRPLAELVGAPVPAGAIPYKLFEVVPGAVIEAPAPPGTRVTARLLLETAGGRRILYRAAALAADDGLARLRVPYPGPQQAGAAQVRALGPWRVRIGSELHELAVGEDDVRTGATVALGGGA